MNKLQQLWENYKTGLKEKRDAQWMHFKAK